MLINNKFNSKLSLILFNLKNNFFSDKLILSNNKFIGKFFDLKRLIFWISFLLSDLSTVKISIVKFSKSKTPEVRMKKMVYPPLIDKNPVKNDINLINSIGNMKILIKGTIDIYKEQQSISD